MCIYPFLLILFLGKGRRQLPSALPLWRGASLYRRQCTKCILRPKKIRREGTTSHLAFGAVATCAAMAYQVKHLRAQHIRTNARLCVLLYT